MNSELDDVDVRGTIVEVLDSADRDEVAGALAAITWLAPAATSPPRRRRWHV